MSDGSLIHEQVEKYLATRPEFRNHIRRTGDGEYLIDGRDVRVGFCRQGYLVVHDGPLRQPFVDYVEKKESTAIYHNDGLRNSSLNSVPKETRISFGDEGNRYSRLDAMKVAKEQAIFREKAATYTNEGQMVPQDLVQKYEKTIDMKLGGKRRWAPQPPRAPEAGPAWWPGGGAPPAAGVQMQMPPAPPTTVQQAVAVAATTVQPAAVAAPGPQRAPSYTPMPVMPTSPQANIFGQVPDLFQMAAARGPPVVASAISTGTVSVTAPVATPMTPMNMFTGGCAQAPVIGLQQPRIVAGHLCGA